MEAQAHREQERARALFNQYHEPVSARSVLNRTSQPRTHMPLCISRLLNPMHLCNAMLALCVCSLCQFGVVVPGHTQAARPLRGPAHSAALYPTESQARTR